MEKEEAFPHGIYCQEREKGNTQNIIKQVYNYNWNKCYERKEHIYSV